jgi:hypothetical protein
MSHEDKRRVLLYGLLWRIGRESSQGHHDDRLRVFLTASKIAIVIYARDGGDNELLLNEAKTKSPRLSIYEMNGLQQPSILDLWTRAGKAP